jgi:NADP-dependent aldehyde dehydrogenase
MIGRVIADAVKKTGMPPGVFSMLQGKGNYIGMALAKHPLTCAVAFTGSLKGGRALFDACGGRPRPIPFYGELGSVNPVFLLPGALKERAAQVAEAFVGSLTMGRGQFCTNPGLVFGLKSTELGNFMDKTAELVKAWQPGTMLHGGIHSAFDSGVERLSGVRGLRLAAKSEAPAKSEASQAAATVFITDLNTFSANESLREEVFGPTSVVTYCETKEDLERLAESFDGQLTASIHGTDDDLKEHARLVQILERKVGRIIFNGFGTGIEVCPSMHHGGLFPAATHSFFTSIGTAAIYRFVRPVCYQGFPDECLPELLQNKNAGGAWRMVDGVMTNGDA